MKSLYKLELTSSEYINLKATTFLLILDSTTNEINKKETNKNSLVSVENSDSIPNNTVGEVFMLLIIRLCNTKKF